MKYFLQFVFYIMLASGMLSLLCVLSFYNLLTSQNTRLHMNHSVSANTILNPLLMTFPFLPETELSVRLYRLYIGVCGGASFRLLHF